MKKCYINGAGCVSAQKTLDVAFLEEVAINEADNILPLAAPDYKEYIAPAAGRRMAKGVKNGIAASASAIKEAGTQNFDAIVTGTGMGCNVDSEKFLTALLDNQEQFLTPTSFIQSTHNTVGAQIALGLQCKAYNFTYVNGAVSFESALIDAQMQLQEDDAHSILVGGIEEAAESTMKFMQLSGAIKSKDNGPYSVLEPKTGGAVFSEGAAFFVIEDEKKPSAYAELKDVYTYNILSQDEITAKVEAFLGRNNIALSDVDAIVLGYNGDVQYDAYYNVLVQGIFKDTPQVYYKHLSGEYYTASAFGMWVAANILKLQQINPVLMVNAVSRSQYKNILLYNQYRGGDHSFILLSAC
ncbi:beta-ketoacyl synthase N-terminal-like domain-containing protein [Flavobacterium sp. RHBU_3]|uniref:beta-ketoacyl synthase N-terminal-like domain-containing protein n=1 Tax=Flavobacterium sp. RHBU_3 TaxID=3391184 RepID=UPI00398471DF